MEYPDGAGGAVDGVDVNLLTGLRIPHRLQDHLRESPSFVNIFLITGITVDYRPKYRHISTATCKYRNIA